MADNYHLTWNAEKEGWDVKKEGASQASDHFTGHAHALARGRDLAAKANGTLVLHDETGAITGSESGEDLTPNVAKRAANKVIGAAQAVKGRLT